ncbi:hypothetical protein DLAC_03448 [Tieghemostelium lacteum]|uniref:Uncharacterized protein n=1 Tax=Tieghemostelium lacteum TaxID=361077 RepID=A0A152A203_TIELA|nr:hypothetical protein DLAC_03448 [Tieghemostelium lacteum]|eukprot:KYR00283.1 hypothetical protein DLAC_03448 [Tieghemostelium lacteum]
MVIIEENDKFNLTTNWAVETLEDGITTIQEEINEVDSDCLKFIQLNQNTSPESCQINIDFGDQYYDISTIVIISNSKVIEYSQNKQYDYIGTSKSTILQESNKNILLNTYQMEPVSKCNFLSIKLLSLCTKGQVKLYTITIGASKSIGDRNQDSTTLIVDKDKMKSLEALTSVMSFLSKKQEPLPTSSPSPSNLAVNPHLNNQIIIETVKKLINESEIRIIKTIEEKFAQISIQIQNLENKVDTHIIK